MVQANIILELFFKLFRCQDKLLRKTLYTYIVSDIKNVNTKHKNAKLNSVRHWSLLVPCQLNGRPTKQYMKECVVIITSNFFTFFADTSGIYVYHDEGQQPCSCKDVIGGSLYISFVINLLSVIEFKSMRRFTWFYSYDVSWRFSERIKYKYNFTIHSHTHLYVRNKYNKQYRFLSI